MSAARVSKAMKSNGLHYTFPRLPLTIRLPADMSRMKKIIIHGAVLASASRFSINLKDAEVAANNYFHFNPRFGEENVVVRNSRFNDAWGTEEREGDNPFSPGEPFLMTITAKDDGFKVKVNGEIFIVFQYRDDMPREKITHLTLKGDLVCYTLVIPAASIPVPLAVKIPSHVSVGDQIVISGETPSGADRFAVNLQCGADESADIMFHFNPRFSTGEIVCNSRCAGEWNSELQGALMIGAGQTFVLSLGVSKDAYHAYLQNTKAVEFGHRLDMSAACVLMSSGDVRVKDVYINCPPTRLPPVMSSAVRELDESAMSLAFSEPVPVTLPLRSPLQPGQMIALTCYICPGPTRCSLNLLCGDSGDDDIALHLNPRWDDDSGNIIVLNTKQGGEWGSEERIENSMEASTYVTLIIYCKDDGFCISVDGDVILPLFEHRMDCRSVSRVAVDGCTWIQRILAA